MKSLIVLLAISTLSLAACGEKAPDPAAPETAVAPTASGDITGDVFEAKLQAITDPDELLALQDLSGGLAANMKNLQVSKRMAELMKDKFNAAPNAYELNTQYEKYAIRGLAQMAYSDAKRALAAKEIPK